MHCMPVGRGSCGPSQVGWRLRKRAMYHSRRALNVSDLSLNRTDEGDNCCHLRRHYCPRQQDAVGKLTTRCDSIVLTSHCYEVSQQVSCAQLRTMCSLFVRVPWAALAHTLSTHAMLFEDEAKRALRLTMDIAERSIDTMFAGHTAPSSSRPPLVRRRATRELGPRPSQSSLENRGRSRSRSKGRTVPDRRSGYQVPSDRPRSPHQHRTRVSHAGGRDLRRARAPPRHPTRPAPPVPVSRSSLPQRRMFGGGASMSGGAHVTPPVPKSCPTPSLTVTFPGRVSHWWPRVPALPSSCGNYVEYPGFTLLYLPVLAASTSACPCECQAPRHCILAKSSAVPGCRLGKAHHGGVAW